jgi:RNA polymerase sigma factor (TIGR02999 family)
MQPSILDRFDDALYEDLRRIARRHLRNERPDRTISTTELVHESFLRLQHQDVMDEGSRTAFLKGAASVMRFILVDHARQRRTAKRGGDRRQVTLEDALVAANDDADFIVELDDALTRFASLSPRAAQVVECRFFAGLSEEETAGALGITSRTVRRDWVKAKGWLYDALQSSFELG